MKESVENLKKRSSNPQLIESAFIFAKEAYKDKFRLSGENQIMHTLRVATTLEKMNLDPTTVVFGILHDALDDIPDSVKKIQLKEICKN